jgi:hypothetical protein
MFLGVGAAPQVNKAPKTATFTLFITNSLRDDSFCPSEEEEEEVRTTNFLPQAGAELQGR